MHTLVLAQTLESILNSSQPISQAVSPIFHTELATSRTTLLRSSHYMFCLGHSNILLPGFLAFSLNWLWSVLYTAERVIFYRQISDYALLNKTIELNPGNCPSVVSLCMAGSSRPDPPASSVFCLLDSRCTALFCKRKHRGFFWLSTFTWIACLPPVSTDSLHYFPSHNHVCFLYRLSANTDVTFYLLCVHFLPVPSKMQVFWGWCLASFLHHFIYCVWTHVWLGDAQYLLTCDPCIHSLNNIKNPIPDTNYLLIISSTFYIFYCDTILHIKEPQHTYKRMTSWKEYGFQP